MSAESARWAIQDLIMTYAARIDAGDLAGVGELFRDGTLHSGGGRTGREAVENWFRDILVIHPDGTPRTRHVTTNVRITAGEDTASAHSYFTVFQAAEDFPLQPIAAGHYDDRFVRRGDEWLFAERTPVLQMTGDLTRHLRMDVVRAAGSAG
ncbi:MULTISPECIES: nuclear transport factor 2 family protein [unclassified Amycolatopsis]|uniref:nuclear transport factor 2 family protein n=1 Tax=unclassified Amycolatopsis TaxID=2618356 RepID=UPI00106ED1A1|nr:MULTISPECIES: nuclear transport factor 2 family protein [unclassified Amycolatopsis]